MSRRSCPVLVLTILALVLAAGPAAAEEPADSACDPALVAALGPGNLDASWLFAAAPPKGGSPDGPGEQAVCNAECCDGSYVTCWGTTCNATDENCPSTAGYCWGASTGYRWCPSCSSSTCTGSTCPPNWVCSASAQCTDGSWVSCNGCSGDCFSVHECYAYCDGTYYWCPDPGGGKICPI